MTACAACIAACATPAWAPRLRQFSLQTITIPLPAPFIDYLREDGIVLPALSPSRTPHALDPRCHSTSSKASSSERDDDASATARAFPELEDNIESAIAACDGAAFVAFDWSAPLDAAWITDTRSVNCACAGQVYLLLKASDAVQEDLERGAHVASVTGRPYQHHIVMKPWYNMPRSGIFRCFSWEKRLIGVSQRHTDEHFTFLVGVEQRAAVRAAVESFFEKALCGPSELQSCQYWV
jgi:hypothetical protein